MIEKRSRRPLSLLALQEEQNLSTCTIASKSESKPSGAFQLAPIS